MRNWLKPAVLAALALGAVLAPAAAPAPALAPAPAEAQADHRWGRDYFPNFEMQDQDGRRLRFYDDVIAGKVVSINFIYTACGDVCPLDTAQLRRVQQILGDRVGRDVHMVTISLNPTRDTPAQLRQFMRTYGVGPGWTFLTGSAADVVTLQQRFGLRPADERSLREHDTSIIVGNERTAQWIKRSAYENPQLLADLLGRRLHNYATPGSATRQSYAAAGEVTDRSHGFYLFRTRCQSCHTVGEGDRLGPDLTGVTRARPHAWLSRWIREPDRMIAERDPTALALLARYRDLPMPNLGLNEAEAEAIIQYLRTRDAAASQRGDSTSRPD
jgi:protein SCO1